MNIFHSLFSRSRCSQRFLPFVAVLFSAMQVQAQPVVIPLYQGTAPGSETWDWPEGETANTTHKFRIAYNVSKPTITVFRPDSANGTAVLVLPGGGGYVINFEHEGNLIAEQLVKKGVTAFVLKYRTGRTTTADPWGETLANMRDTALNRKKLEGIRPLSIADVSAAMRYIRSNASRYGINPKKVGVLGFSAGGGHGLRLCTSAGPDLRPDFAGLLYSVYRPAPGDTLPATVPPVFIACASDDVLASPLNSTTLYTAWLRTKRPAELHIYTRGGHGLRGSKPALAWLRRFEEWMETIGEKAVGY